MTSWCLSTTWRQVKRNLVSRGAQFGLALAVVLQALSAGVSGEPIRLHHKLGQWPEEVDLMAEQPSVHLRARQVVALAEPQKATLELAAGEVDRPRRGELGAIAKKFRLPPRSAELVGRGAAGQVRQGSGWRRHGNVEPPGRLPPGKAGGAVQADAIAVAPARGAGDQTVHRARARCEHPPQSGGRPMAEYGRVSARLDRSRPAPLVGEARVAHRVNAAVDAV